MITETVRAEWVAGQVFQLSDRGGQVIRMTQPDGVNGADLLPLSLLGCALWDIAAILRKQRQPLTALRGAAESQRDTEPPWAFRAIHLRYTLTGPGLNPVLVRRAIHLAENKYCSIHATLRPVVALTSEFEIVAA
jgi:putative redox protein